MQTKRSLKNKQEELEIVTSKKEKKAIKQEIQAIEAEIKKRKKDELKLTKKSSLLVSFFNKAMNDNSVYRENYWGRSLNGNNTQKFLKNHKAIFSTFAEKVRTNYPNFPLLQRCQKYTDLFSAFYEVYRRINHSRQVSLEECDQAQAAIESYTTLVHTFGWKSSTNKVIKLLLGRIKRMPCN